MNYICAITIWTHWAQRMYQAIVPEPWLQFVQAGPYFLQNHKMNF